MKQYIGNSRLTLVGKAWEIRHQLKLLSKTGLKSAADLPAPTLDSFLRSSRPQS